MSRIGKKLIVMPAGVSAKIENNVLTISGPKGTLTQEIDKNIKTNINGQELSFEVIKNTQDSNVFLKPSLTPTTMLFARAL